jgi:hypothetical protein
MFQARAIQAEDQRTVIQVRVDLGVFQMEVTGRPDGLKPGGHETVRDMVEERRAREQDAFALDEEDCRAIRDEALQFYHRYVALFSLKQYEAVIHDAEHNLACLDLCHDFASSERDRGLLEHMRPQFITIRVRAAAELAMAHRQPRAALVAIDRGLEELAALLDPDELEHSNEIILLRGMRDMLVPKLPSSQRVELGERLQAALDAENYELAAILRDELRMMRD